MQCYDRNLINELKKEIEEKRKKISSNLKILSDEFKKTKVPEVIC